MRWLIGFRARFRRVRMSLILPALVLLLGSQFLGAIHHHTGAASRETCALCVVSHAPAVGGPEAPTPAAPRLAPELLYHAPDVAPRDRPLLVALGRSPPSA